MPILASGITTLDIVIIAVYFLMTFGMGVYFSRKNKTTEAYFLGNRGYSGWVIGISMLATSISSITFLALPAAAYALDWRLLINSAMLPIAIILAWFYFIPIYRHGKVTSVFEYLEKRYGPGARLYGAIAFIMIQFFRVGTILYLVSLPIAALTRWPMVWVVIGVGIAIAFYTVAGGIEAVIWTDVIQAFILWGGGFVALGVMLYYLPGGLGEVFHTATKFDKFNIGSLEWAWSERTLYVMLMNGLFSQIGNYTGDQNIVQRYLAASSTKEARKASILAVSLSIPTWTIFFFIGTTLFVYYQVVGGLPDGLKAEQVFPHFIIHVIPPGLTGIILSAILAAAMSSLDSNINATSSIVVTDILRRHVAPNRSEKYYLYSAWGTGLLMATLMIIIALLLHLTPMESLINTLNIIVSSLAGAMMGIFFLGFFTTRVSYRAVMLALIPAILVNAFLLLNAAPWWPARLYLALNPYWNVVVINIVFMVCACLISLFLKETVDINKTKHLTVWTMKDIVTAEHELAKQIRHSNDSTNTIGLPQQDT